MARPPFLGHPLGEPPKLGAVDLLSPAEGGLKGFPACHSLIDGIVGIDASQRGVREVPFRAIETVTLVNERHVILARPDRLSEYDLAPVRFPRPLVQHKHTGLW